MVEITIRDHLIIPFGGPKWNIANIRVTGVSTGATYLQSDTPCAYIDKARSEPLRIHSLSRYVPESIDDVGAHDRIYEDYRRCLRKYCDERSEYERRFLDNYLDYCIDITTPPAHWDKSKPPYDHPAWRHLCLLPLPQAHLYCIDPLSRHFSYTPDNMFKVDFAFWTGSKLVAVEIDGRSHIGDETHIRKDRMLRGAGVDIYHVTNSEVIKHGTSLIQRILPKEIVEYWKHPSGKVLHPSNIETLFETELDV